MNWRDLAEFSESESRSASFENPKGTKGAGGQAASDIGIARKGAAWKQIEPGEECVLAEIDGPGVIRHIWFTQQNTPQILRGVVLRMYWDGQKEPSVECPVGDFFGVAHGRTVHFFNALQAMQEGRGLNSYFQMPFAKGAKIVYCNELSEPVPSLYYSIDYTIGDKVDDSVGRFHCCFQRENPTRMAQDFTILPQRTGKGRFLGTVVGVRTLSPQWWGEGEFKVFVDGDRKWPTIVGTGTEDYIGSAWGVGQHFAFYAGCPYIFAQGDWQRLISFYRFHVADPIYFRKDIRIEMQQITGGFRPDGTIGLAERADDWSAAAFWYQNLGEPLPKLPSLQERIANLEKFPGET